MTTLMTINGLSAEINMPDAPKGEDKIHGLPPYLRQEVFVVDEYEGCPTEWMHGSDKASSYFVQLTPGKHLWLDFNANWVHTHHVAAVISIQGINPITGDQTKELRLEQYREKCPRHDIPFQHERFCEKCGYMWPGQNYMTTVSTPSGQFWIDGFRAEKGTIRGFLITEETVRGIAKQVLGDDRVFAVGVAFYLSKEPKPLPVQHINTLRYVGPKKHYLMAPPYTDDYGLYADSAPIASWDVTSGGGASPQYTMSNSVQPKGTVAPASLNARGILRSRKRRSGPGGSSCRSEPESLTSGLEMDREVDDGTECAKLEIAAGAKINQELAYFDPSDLTFYQDEPAGMLYINYADKKQFTRIMKKGKKDFTKGGEGFLAGLQTGNA